MNEVFLARLRELREMCRATANDLDDDNCRRQFHPELSPLGWHLGHVFYVEAFWLSETVFCDSSIIADRHNLYQPEHCPKLERGQRLPSKSELQDWCARISSHNDVLWSKVILKRKDHPLLENNYLARFLIQHYAQHFETLQMVRQQHQVVRAGKLPAVANFPSDSRTPEFVDLKSGVAPIGAETRDGAYDNEASLHSIELPAFRIARRPVSNSEWCVFMSDGGYTTHKYWSAEGWQWRQAENILHPQHWRRTGDAQWYSLEAEGPSELASNATVCGLSWHEAQAYASWAGARLPHEYEWETAMRMGLLEQTGESWEWCANTLHPYPGFRPFPYDGYSLPWFDGKHYVLRGGSRHTQPEIKRPSFRNFYLPTHRHIFAGLRLAR